MEIKRKNYLRRCRRDLNMENLRSTLASSLKSVALRNTLVVLLTFGLVQSGEF